MLTFYETRDMALKGLADAQKRRYQGSVGPSEAAREQEFRRILRKPEDMTAEELAEARLLVLRNPEWGNSTIFPLGISLEEKIDAHMNYGAERAASWVIEPRSHGLVRSDYRRWALHCNGWGWNVFPETFRNGRMPGRFGGVQVRPSTFTDQLRPRLHVATECASSENRWHNVAVNLGAGGGHVRVVDIDTADEVLAQQLHDLADEVLGKTPFVRVGRFPRRQLYYRCEYDDAQTIAVGKFSRVFMNVDGQPDVDEDGKALNSIEYLSAGSNATLYGIHHRTGSYFDWSLGTLHPAIAGPEEAPVITKDTLNEFFNRADGVRPIKRSSAGSPSDPRGNGNGVASAFEKSGDIWMPKKIEGDWTVEDGIVTDGREAFLAQVTWSICAANAHLVLDRGSEIQAAGRDWAVSGCSTRAIKHHSVASEFDAKWSTVITKWRNAAMEYDRTGEWPERMNPYRLTEDGRRATEIIVPASPRPTDGTLDWLPMPKISVVEQLNDKAGVKLIAVEQTDDDIAANKQARALLEDPEERRAEHERVAGAMQASMQRIIDGVETYLREPVGQPPAYILAAPTGAGKTALSIREIGMWCKANPRQHDQGPIIFALPTHENMSELLQKAQAEGMTVPNPETVSLEDAEAMLRASGVKVTTFKGKIAAGCLRPDDLRALEDKQISSSGLCGADVVTDSELEAARKRREGEKLNREEILCEHRESGACGYFRQHVEVMTADIVLVAHHYIDSPSLPKILKTARAVIIDESITFRMLKQRTMALEIFDLNRPEPYLTKAEKAEGIDKFELVQQRNVVSKVAYDALVAGQDPATAISKAGLDDYVDAAIKVVSRARGDDRGITPKLSSSDVARIVADKKQIEDLIGEEKFWRLIKDRAVARGDIDRRLQAVMIAGDDKELPRPGVRMSWRAEANWAEAPMVLLDASAAPAIIEKLLDRPVHREDVSARMHLRTVAILDQTNSNSQFAPKSGTTEQRRKAAAKARSHRASTRLLLEKIGTLFGYSRGLVGSTTAVQLALQATEGERWTPPANLDWRHFGALRGLDFAKNHAFAVGIGRTEQPIGVVDGYAAALTYDDDAPQKPYDKDGDGGRMSGAPVLRVLKPRRLKMRNGVDYDIEVMTFPEEFGWANLIEQQWREEELRQFVGRLRAVYRDGDPGVYIAIGRIIPDDVIVDEVVNMTDLLTDRDFFSLSSASGGVLDDFLTPGMLKPAKILARLQDRENADAKTWNRDPKQVTVGNLNSEAFSDPKYSAAFERSIWKIRYVAEGNRRLAYVMGYHDAPVAALRDAAEKADVAIDEIISVEDPQLRKLATKAGRNWVAEEVSARIEAQIVGKAEEIFDSLPDLLRELPLLRVENWKMLVADADAQDVSAMETWIEAATPIADQIAARQDEMLEMHGHSSDWDADLSALLTDAVIKCDAGIAADQAFAQVLEYLHLPQAA